MFRLFPQFTFEGDEVEDSSEAPQRLGEIENRRRRRSLQGRHPVFDSEEKTRDLQKGNGAKEGGLKMKLKSDNTCRIVTYSDPNLK
jgi:hypothetical protein